MRGRPIGAGGRNRSGFSLVEFLVVLGLISLLIGLSFPAVQAARDAVRRVRGANNQHRADVAATVRSTSP